MIWQNQLFGLCNGSREDVKVRRELLCKDYFNMYLYKRIHIIIMHFQRMVKEGADFMVS